MEYISKDDSNIRIGAVLGLGIAYAGTQKEEVEFLHLLMSSCLRLPICLFLTWFLKSQLKMHLSAVLGNSQSPLEVLVFSAISLGLVFVGSCNEEISQSMIFALMERSEAELKEPIIRLLPVALGLLYLGKQVSFVVLNFQS
jgi:26S proteasome regulatory subunit N1